MISKRKAAIIGIWDKQTDILCLGVLPVILMMKKADLRKGLLCCAAFLCAACVFRGASDGLRALSVFASADEPPITVVIDPGHGGEDGGAVSPDGVAESHINLAIASMLRDLLCFSGQETLMTREKDVMVCDEGLGSIRERKASDIRNRVSMVEGAQNAILLSIHQNSLPSSTVTHGAQVFWNQQEGAEELAAAIQETLNRTVNAGNEKRTKRIPPTVYLMKHVTVPAVLVECGFLTNREETRLLQNETYQRGLAVSIAAGYLRGTSEGELP